MLCKAHLPINPPILPSGPKAKGERWIQRVLHLHNVGPPPKDHGVLAMVPEKAPQMVMSLL